MREIKFRGKRIDTGEWVYGYLIKGEYTYIISPEQFYSAVVTIGGRMCTDSYIVDPATIGQYTGLKDRTGKEIYKGDIVRVSLLTTFGEDALINGVVYWCDCAWWIDGTETGGDEAIGGLGYPFKYIEVIGNIHDNPELLEVSQ